MSLFSFVYDTVMQAAEDACLRDWRRELLADVDGHVLELGAGTGASLALYPQREGLRLHLAEPDADMRALLEKKLAEANRNDVTVLSCPAEQIDARDGQFDAVFVSLVCCSVRDVTLTLAEIRRVLKPEGRFIFLEHVAAEHGSPRRKWQNRLNFIWKRIAGNCHLNRDTQGAIEAAGFEIRELRHDSLRKAIPLVRPSIRGWANKGSELP